MDLNVITIENFEFILKQSRKTISFEVHKNRNLMLYLNQIRELLLKPNRTYFQNGLKLHVLISLIKKHEFLSLVHRL